jgi:hypothetical protein
VLPDDPPRGVLAEVDQLAVEQIDDLSRLTSLY